MDTRTPVAGIHSVRSALKFGADGVAELWLERSRRDQRLHELADLAKAAGIAVRQVARDELDRVGQGANHQGALAWVRAPAARGESHLADILDAIEGPPFLLILDGVQDPHNLGAFLRTADGAGVHAWSRRRTTRSWITPVVDSVARRGRDLPYVQVTNLARTMDLLKDRGIWLYGAAGDAEASLYETDLTGPLGLVTGNEGKGLRRLTRERCDGLIRLPMHGRVESLNVSVATGVCLQSSCASGNCGLPRT